jgi:uncharacterized protein (TIGR03790 family)
MLLQRRLTLLLLSGLLILCRNNNAAAQSAANVLLVINDSSQASRTIGEYYMRKRDIPAANICRVTVGSDDGIGRADYERLIQQPITRCITSTAAQDRILYIVLTKGVPLRVHGTGGRDGTVSSVDSELAILYRRHTGVAVPIAGPIANPYFAGNQQLASPTSSRVFTHDQADIYLVTRLDGFSVPDVLALIDRSMAPVKEGRILLDGRSSWQATGNVWLRTAADTLKGMGVGDRVEFDEGAKVISDARGVLGYYSWGSNDPAIKARTPNVTFVPGALAAMFVSTDARTFTEPPAGWKIGSTDKPETFYAGSPQSLIGDLIRAGVTATAGHVAEPFLDATIRPDILFPAYMAGANVAEAFYLAMPYVSWQTVVIGDPLCAPFRPAAFPAETFDRGIDPVTELPVLFGARRLKFLEANPVKRDALTALLRYEARMGRGNVSGAREAAEQAVAVDPHLTAAHIILAMEYQADGLLDKAIEHYRALISYLPNQVVALNNLAYILAVDKNLPLEGLPLAERAHAIAPKDPMMLDTLAWIQHLLKRDTEAVRSIQEAVAAAPGLAELRWHAAVIFAAVSDPGRALTELDAAVKINPKVADEGEIRKLRERLAPKVPSR